MADGRVGRVDDAGGGVGGGVSQRLSQTAVVVAPRRKEAMKVLDVVEYLRVWVCTPLSADIASQTSACGHLPADTYLRTSACRHLAADTCLQISARRPNPKHECVHVLAHRYMSAGKHLQA
jgi:hypothetical protein